MAGCCHDGGSHLKDERDMKLSETKAVRGKKSNLPLVIGGCLAVLVITFAYLFDLKVVPNQRFNNLTGKQAAVAEVAGETPTAIALAEVVVPEEGYTVNIRWGDTGKKLVETGAIDLEKFNKNYGGEENKALLSYLTETKDEGITINKQNAYFWVNTLWALGLTQKSDVLDKGEMAKYPKDKLGGFASTGGWTLGAKPAVDLFSSAEIMSLTAPQQELVRKISENVYRPCCGNSTAFPDCNHGMAALALIELMVSQGAAEQEIYQAVLAFNSYWFSQTYVDLAYYFQTKENTAWDKVDPKQALSANFSSARGYQAIKQQIGPVPGTQGGGSSCGA